MRVVITGASGFLGKHLVSKLRQNQEAGLEIVGVSRQKTIGVLQVSDYGEIPSGDVLIHLAEENSRSGAEIGGGAELAKSSSTIESFIKKKFSKIIYASSAVLYGDLSITKHSTADSLIANNAYASLKLAGEQAILATGKGIALRISNLYGEGMSENNVMNTIVRQAILGNKVVVESLEPIRDFLWIEDATQAIARLVQDNSEIGPKRVVNIGSGIGTSIRELAETALTVAGRSNFDISARSTSTPSCIILNIEETIKQLGWSPTVDIHAGLSRLMNHKK